MCSARPLVCSAVHAPSPPPLRPLSLSNTQVTDFLAFGIGAFIDLPAISYFCITASIAVLAVFAIQVTFFAACLAIDARRIENSRYDLLPCLVRRKWTEREEQEDEPAPSSPNVLCTNFASFLTRPKMAPVLVALFVVAGVSMAVKGVTTIGKGIAIGDFLPEGSCVRERALRALRSGSPLPPPPQLRGEVLRGPRFLLRRGGQPRDHHHGRDRRHGAGGPGAHERALHERGGARGDGGLHRELVRHGTFSLSLAAAAPSPTPPRRFAAWGAWADSSVEEMSSEEALASWTGFMGTDAFLQRYAGTVVLGQTQTQIEASKSTQMVRAVCGGASFDISAPSPLPPPPPTSSSSTARTWIAPWRTWTTQGRPLPATTASPSRSTTTTCGWRCAR